MKKTLINSSKLFAKVQTNKTFNNANNKWMENTIVYYKYVSSTSTIKPPIGGVQLIPWDSNDEEIFAMLDEIILADKEKPLLNSTNMAAMT